MLSEPGHTQMLLGFHPPPWFVSPARRRLQPSSDYGVASGYSKRLSAVVRVLTNRLRLPAQQVMAREDTRQGGDN